jgi:trehalose 6-phosphate phosphatase
MGKMRALVQMNKLHRRKREREAVEETTKLDFGGIRLEHLLVNWQQVAVRVTSARHILIVSDFDGTLAPIAGRPGEAILPERTKELLQALAKKPNVVIGIVSGRALDDLRSKVGIEGITYAGNHGLEIEGPEIVFVNPLAEQAKFTMQRLYRVLSRALSGIGGVVIEDKRLTLSVHYRLVDEEKAGQVENVFSQIVGRMRAAGRIRTTYGKKVLEVRPAVDWDKGKAISLMLDRQVNASGEGGFLPIFMGDDVTDEDGFAAIEDRGGISVFVGNEKDNSAAQYFVESPAEVQQLLGQLLNLIEDGHA